MNTRYKYGFAWINLIIAFVLCAGLGLGTLWLALTNKNGWEFAGISFSSAGFSIITFFIGGSFTFCAWLLLTIMRRQKGMQNYVWLEADSLHLPVMGKGSVTILLNEITELENITKAGQKKLNITTSQQQYELESRMMEKLDHFESLAAAIKAQAPQAKFIEINKK